MGSEHGRAHREWYRLLAEYYDHLYDPRRIAWAYPFLQDLLRHRGPISGVLDVTCGTFALAVALRE
ncbi:MAG TPA: hypothetical protein VEY12_05605 [Thermoplasmata archaeon]|nr:hypothetical protein [Thermoplasmata archaeon]